MNVELFIKTNKISNFGRNDKQMNQSLLKDTIVKEQRKSQTKRFVPFVAEVKSDHLLRLEDENIHLAMTGGVGPGNWLSKAGTVNFSAPIYAETHSCFAGGSFFNLGSHSYSKSALPHGVSVGRYCSISSNVRVMPANHPLDRLSTCGFDYASSKIYPDAFTKKKHIPLRASLSIGNDVWIGHGATLGRGIQIGDGSVIGYGAIVTRDVPPYAVVAGSPAQIRRYRFDEKTIERLVRSCWWDFDPDCLSGLDTINVPAFLDAFEEMAASKTLRRYSVRRIALHEIFAE